MTLMFLILSTTGRITKGMSSDLLFTVFLLMPLLVFEVNIKDLPEQSQSELNKI